MNGGALLANGKNTVLNIDSTTFQGNRALNEGGGIYLLGSAEATLIKTSVTECSANRNGGGMSTRGAKFPYKLFFTSHVTPYSTNKD